MGLLDDGEAALEPLTHVVAVNVLAAQSAVKNAVTQRE